MARAKKPAHGIVNPFIVVEFTPSCQNIGSNGTSFDNYEDAADWAKSEAEDNGEMQVVAEIVGYAKPTGAEYHELEG